jgi:hypothetical protein
VPVIGDLLVSRRGEGVFGMTYSINGSVESPRVGVNPVSALTPGILRRIFEPLPQREGNVGGAHSLPPALPPPEDVVTPPQPQAIAVEAAGSTQASLP